MSTIAFALHPGADSFAGAVLARHDGSGFDVAAELDKGAGTIVVSAADDALVALLDAVPVLQRVSAPAAYADRTVEDLRDLCRARDLPVGGTKAELVARLDDHDNPAPSDDGGVDDTGTAGEEA